MIEADVIAPGTLKITCARDDLIQKLGVVSRGVSTRTAVQILSGVLLTASGDQLTLAATDMELSLRGSLEARVDGEGSAVLPGRTFVEIARLLPADEVTVEHRFEEGIVEIVCGSASYRLHTYNAEDFPRLPDVEAIERHAIDRDAMLETVQRVGRSASRDESRPVLTGILVRFETGRIVMAATDSYRLSVKETPLTQGPDHELEAIVPARALAELARIGQAAATSTLEIGVQENQ